MTVFTKLYLVYMIIYLFMQTHFYCKLLKPKTFLRHPFWQCYFLAVIFTLPSILLKDTNKAFATIYINVCSLLFSLVLFQNPVPKRVSCFIAWFITSTVGESLAGFSYTLIYHLTGIELLPLNLSGSDDILPIAASLVIDFLFIFAAYMGSLYLLSSRFNYISSLLLLELSSPIIISQMVLSVLYASGSKKQYYILAAVTILAYIASFFPLQKGMRQLKKQERIRLSNESLKSYAQKQADQFKNLESEYSNLRKWNHDMSNHLISLSYLFTQKHYKEAKEYADTLLQKTKTE